ncbi:hypothetical protein [Labilibaculum euxinus]|uniref:Uncharacterized protein n=1 Tax=Labilibaculum euxinus TaxID=2686357 RepID=A0A7M4DB49_9BACT|nr:hypothetical protein [Labilibaculum euxinus]MUP39878.1 hypothetical protein [Labilibaculum euxinus]MVB09083.1 hypothetical protein [Labilibaculum euxinus]
MNRKQTKQAQKLLAILCEKERIGRTAIDSIINGEDIDLICDILENEKLISIDRVEVSGVYSISKTNKTCIGYSSSKKPNPNNIINRLLKNPVFQIIGIIGSIYTFLKIIESIFNCDIPII